MHFARTNPHIQCVIALSMLLGSFATNCRAADTSVNMQSLLREMIDFDSIARWPSPAFTLKQASSYDRSQKSPDQPGWFGNNDFSNYLRTEQHEGRTEHVMMDADGPGAIVRFWITSMHTKGMRIRLYLDGADHPAIEWPIYDLRSWPAHVDKPLLDRHPGLEDRGGSTLYLPIPYSRHCKVTLELGQDAAEHQYYQIGYRTYPQGTSVESFTYADIEANHPLIDQVNQTLAPPHAREGSAEVQRDLTIPAGGSSLIELPPGPSAIKQLEFSLSDAKAHDRPQLLERIVLRSTFDDQVDTISCPLSGFAGSGPGYRPLESWYRSIDSDGRSVSRWTMPYQHRASLLLENHNSSGVHLSVKAKASPWVWDDRSMYFHTTWHQTLGLASDPPSDLNYLKAKGRGVLAGDVTAVLNPFPSWYGEGDERIWVDDDKFPSIPGTGLEDYYNASWAPNPIYQTPFANQPQIEQAQGQGQNCYTRTRNLDAVPFEHALRFDFEVSTWMPSRLDWSSTVYWYSRARD